MGFHPDRLLSPAASQPVRIAYRMAKFLVSILLGWTVFVGISAFFQPSPVTELAGALGALGAIVLGYWLWKGDVHLHPDQLVPPDAGRLARGAMWLAKYIAVGTLAYVMIAMGLSAFFEPPIQVKALCATSALGALLAARWLWPSKPLNRPS